MSDEAEDMAPSAAPEVLLSILVCTLPERKFYLMRLANRLLPQVEAFNGQVEVLCDPRPRNMLLPDGRKLTIGQKRNDLLQRARGEYVAFVDDDDLVNKGYVQLIVTALETRPDCCSLVGIQTVDGKDDKPFFHSIVYDSWFEADGWRLRGINHLNTVKRSLAIQAGFTDKNHGEDRDYSMAIGPLLKTQVHIREPLYRYEFVTSKQV